MAKTRTINMTAEEQEAKRAKREARRKKRAEKKAAENAEPTPTAEVIARISPLSDDEVRMLIRLLEKATGHAIMDMGVKRK